jgi:hypothetical protein
LGFNCGLALDLFCPLDCGAGTGEDEEAGVDFGMLNKAKNPVVDLGCGVALEPCFLRGLLKRTRSQSVPCESVRIQEEHIRHGEFNQQSINVTNSSWRRRGSSVGPERLICS